MPLDLTSRDRVVRSGERGLGQGGREDRRDRFVRRAATECNVIELSPAILDQLRRAYTRVFSGPSGFEIEKCRHCGRAYPGPVLTRPPGDDSYGPGMRCWNPDCRHPLELIDFYDDPEDRLGERIIRDALGQDGFVGLAARGQDRDLVGFAWGYRLPTADTPTVEFSSTSTLLADLGFDAATAFYAAEIGVVPEWQGVGVASRLARARFREAVAAGFSHVCFRTVDRPRVLGLYERMFGAGRIRELFPDPDPAKSQIWFAADLADLSAGPRS